MTPLLIIDVCIALLFAICLGLNGYFVVKYTDSLSVVRELMVEGLRYGYLTMKGGLVNYPIAVVSIGSMIYFDLHVTFWFTVISNILFFGWLFLSAPKQNEITH